MDEKEKNKSKNDEEDHNQPSTSSGITHSSRSGKDEEMLRLLKETDDILEDKAKSMNLSSLNVKSILHHLIKYPRTIDVLLGIRENDDLPSVRNTRSRKNPSQPNSATQTPQKFALRFEDKRPKNFLDVEYEEDDEFDTDYVQEEGKSPKRRGVTIEEEEEDEEETEVEEEEEEENEDEEEEEDDEDDDGPSDEVEEVEAVDDVTMKTVPEAVKVQHETPKSEEKKAEKLEEKSNNYSFINEDSLDALFMEHFKDTNKANMNMTLNDTMERRPESTAPLATLDNLRDDEGYLNFVKSINGPQDDTIIECAQQDIEDDEDNDEDYNFFTDHDNLNIEDWDETRQDRTTMIPRHEVKGLIMDTLLAEKDIPVEVLPEEVIYYEDHYRKSQKEKDAEVREIRDTSIIAAPVESCSLLKDTPVTFRPEEIQLLQVQLMQHVQLLTQFVTICYHDPNLGHVRNRAQTMLNELDDTRQRKNQMTFFDVSTLNGALESCHRIGEYPEVEENMAKWHYYNEGQYDGNAIRPEAVATLAESRAVVFPELLPMVQPIFLAKPLPFLYQEDVMLAMALLQFAHLPRKSDRSQTMDRYKAMEKYCLPARSAYTIRNHLKTMRKFSEKQTPIHSIIQSAERGVCNLVLPQKPWLYYEGPLSMWPEDVQPYWYRLFLKKFKITEENQIQLKIAPKIVLTPIKKKNSVEENVQRKEQKEQGDGDKDEQLIEVGKGAGGQTVVMDREHLEELVNQLIREKEIFPAKRRKNSMPMKLSQLAEVSHLVEENEHIISIPFLPSAPMGAGPSTSMAPEPAKSAVRSLKPKRLEEPRASTSSGASGASGKAMPTASKPSVGPSTSSAPEARNSIKRLPSREGQGEPALKKAKENTPAPSEAASTTSAAPPPKPLPKPMKIEEPMMLTDSKPPKIQRQPIYRDNTDSMSCNSFPIPITPGRRTPDLDEDFFLDLESNSLMWNERAYSVTMGNPRTPRGYSEEPEQDGTTMGPIDFSHFHSERAPLNMNTEEYYTEGEVEVEEHAQMDPDDELTSSSSGTTHHGGQQRHVSESMDEEGSLTGFDLVPPDEDEEVVEEEAPADRKKRVQNLLRRPLKSKPGTTVISRKRTRAERESMGALGLTDSYLIEYQTHVVLKKILEDAEKRLFMHTDTWQQLKSALMENGGELDKKKYEKISKILENHKELKSLIFLYAPRDALPNEFYNSLEFQNTKKAMEMILTIERYVKCAKLKEPSIGSIFRYIRSFLNENPETTDEQAAGRFFQLLGQDRPLWNLLEPSFGCLPYRKKPKLEQFEYVDLCPVDKFVTRREEREKKKYNSNSKFESIDDIDLLMPTWRSHNSEKSSSLMVKCGELFIKNEIEDTLTQLEVSERQWTRKDDIELITKFNAAYKAKPAFRIEDMPKLVPELQFGAKSIVARLRYLLKELQGTG